MPVLIIFTKEVDILLRPRLTFYDGYLFLRQSMKRRFNSYAHLIQADDGPEFKDKFKKHVLEYAQRHWIVKLYEKNEQSYIESFNRTLRKECLGWTKYRIKDLPMLTREVEDYLDYYHTKGAHLLLDLKTPNNALREYYTVSDI